MAKLYVLAALVQFVKHQIKESDKYQTILSEAKTYMDNLENILSKDINLPPEALVDLRDILHEFDQTLRYLRKKKTFLDKMGLNHEIA